MHYIIHDLADSKEVPTPARDAMLAMQDKITALEAEIERLKEGNNDTQTRCESRTDFDTAAP